MTGAELSVVIGMFESSMDTNEWPDEVKENFAEKVDTLVEHMHDEVTEFLAFAEAYEGGEESETA
jgi:hypothetical protein